jgi:hypothetical protein
LSNKIIRAELETRLKAWADSQVPKIPVAFEGVSFTKPNNGPMLECFLLPSATLDSNVSGTRKTRLGIFHVNVWAQSGKGMGQAESLAQSIVDLFPMLPRQGTVSIESTPFAGDHQDDIAGWLGIPVTIQYRHES